MNLAAKIEEISEDLESRLRFWGRVYGQRRPSEWDEDASLTPSPSANAMERAAASEMGRPARLRLLKHVNRAEPHCPARNWGQFAVSCSETRTPKALDPRPQPEADVVELAALILYRVEPVTGVVLRIHYCTRGTMAEKAEAAGVVIGERVSVRTYRTELDKAKWWMRGALHCRKYFFKRALQ